MSLVLTVQPFQLSGYSFAGGSITLPPNTRVHVGVAISTGTLVTAPATTNVDRTVLWCATVTTGPTDIQLIIEHDPLMQIELAEYVSSPTNYLDFNTAPGALTFQPGRLFWDPEAGALAYNSEFAGVTNQIGRELWARCRNQTGVTIPNGSVVYIVGAGSRIPRIALASATTNTAIDVLGIATMDIPNNSEGMVTVFGSVGGLNTSAWSDGTGLYLSDTPGQLTPTPPGGSSSQVFVALVLDSHVNQGVIDVRISALPGGPSGTVFGTINVDTIRETTPGNGVDIPDLSLPPTELSVLDGTEKFAVKTSSWAQTQVSTLASFVTTIYKITVHSGVGAAARTLIDILRDMPINPVAFGADPTGATDSTAAGNNAIAAAIALGRLHVHFPAGSYRTTGWTISGQPVKITGAGKYATKFLQSGTGNCILFDGVAGGSLSSVGIFRQDVATAGSAVRLNNSSNCTLSSIYVDSCWNAFTFNVGQSNKLWDFEAWYVKNFGIYGFGSYNVDIDISDGVLNGEISGTAGPGMGVRLLDTNHAFNLKNVEIINFNYAVATESSGTYGSWTAGYGFAFSTWTAVYCDSCTQGTLFDKVIGIDLVGCWFSNRPNVGVTISNADGITFTGGKIANCATHGVSVANSAKRVTFNGVQIIGNGTATANTWAGIAFAAGCTDFKVTNCTFANTWSMGTMKYGVQIQAGVSDRYIITGNLFGTMGTAGILDGGTGSNKVVSGNVV